MSDRSDIALLPTSIVETASSGTTTALDRYLGSTVGASAVAYRIPAGMQRNGLAGACLIDTEARGDHPPVSAGDALTHWHVLWIRDETNASVTV
ncbi:MAG TPA: hypothetical protein VD789_08665, partial [Thermomicrobiales bacterium]|nr:hypothetical protein [Thermomicrobiales bacterium]